MPVLVPAIHVFAGGFRTSVKSKFLRLLATASTTLATIDFRDNTPASVMRAEMCRLIADWWPRCSKVASALPIRLVAEAPYADKVLRCLLDAASSIETCAVPLVLQLFDINDDSTSVADWRLLTEEARKRGRFSGLHVFLLSPQFRGTNLHLRTSPLLAFLVAMFALTHSRQESGIQWFQKVWSEDSGIWATSLQSVVAPDLHVAAEHIVDYHILSALSPTYSPRVVEGIQTAARTELPLRRMLVTPINGLIPAATRQFFLNERLGGLLIRTAEHSTSLGQMCRQIEALTAEAPPVVRETLEDLAIEITRVESNPPTSPSSPTPEVRHLLEDVFSLGEHDLLQEVQAAVKPIFDFHPIPIAMYFGDIVGTRLQATLRTLRETAINCVSDRIGERFHADAVAKHYEWLRPSYQQDKLSVLLSDSGGLNVSKSVVRSFVHTPDMLHLDLREEIIRMPNTISFSQFMAFNK